MARDKSDCRAWAEEESGFSPTEETIKDAGVGAAIGALGGAAAGAIIGGAVVALERGSRGSCNWWRQWHRDWAGGQVLIKYILSLSFL